MSLYRLLLTTYLASHVVRYVFENPPIISRSILKDLGELINEGLIELRTLMVGRLLESRIGVGG